MTFIGIGIAARHQAPSTPAVPDLYPDPPWVDDLTDAASLGWQQFGSETNVGTYGVSGFALTVQASNSAIIAPVGALTEDGTTSADVDAVVIGTMTPGSGATGGLQAIRSDPSINGYVAQLKQDATTYTIELSRLAGGAGTVLATLALNPAVAWGGVWLKTEVVGSDTRLRALVWHPADSEWYLALDHTDVDASDDDHAGQPWIGMWSVGGSTDFALTGYEGHID